MSKPTKKSLKQQADEVLALAEKSGVESNYFFRTTFARYQVQMRILDELEKEIVAGGALVTKEYVKGRGNLYTNPAIAEYNKTATAANNSVATLINIVKSLRSGEQKEESLADMMAKLVDD